MQFCVFNEANTFYSNLINQFIVNIIIKHLHNCTSYYPYFKHHFIQGVRKQHRQTFTIDSSDEISRPVFFIFSKWTPFRSYSATKFGSKFFFLCLSCFFLQSEQALVQVSSLMHRI